MKRHLRVLLFAFVALSIAGLIATVFVSFKLKRVYEFSVSDMDGATLKKVRYSGTRDGRREWELEADSATRLEASDQLLLKNVRLVYYTKDGIRYTLKGREGTYGTGSGDITVRGDVTVVSDGDFTLETDYLMYSSRDRTVTTDRRFHLTSDRMDVTGVGFMMEIDTERLNVLKDVRTVLKDAVI